MKSDIEKIIHDGIHAPSGENCQPWRFEVKGAVVTLFNVTEDDVSLYDPHHKVAYIAHGALIENISISAANYGYNIHVTLFPDTKDVDRVATIVFEKGVPVIDSLFSNIKNRCTNRKTFTGEKLSDDQKNTLRASLGDVSFSKLILTDEDAVLPKLGRALAVNEEVLFQNKKIHDFFYNHIIWNKKDEDKASGFYVDTLEFLPHQLGPVKLLKNWTILSILNKLVGVSEKIANENGEKYGASGTLGALVITSEDKKDYVQVGRDMQRVWLTATSLGLAFHPCCGTIYFMDHIRTNIKGFSLKEEKLIESAYHDLELGFGVKEGVFAFVFRVGRADPPTARSKRMQPIILYS